MFSFSIYFFLLSSFLLVLVLVLIPSSTLARPQSIVFMAELKPVKGKPSKGGSENEGGMGGFFGPRGGFGVTGFQNGWGNGVAGGGGNCGPGGGYSKEGVVRPTVVCKEKGSCYNKKVTCPAKCFSSYSRSGKNSDVGGRGGSCTVECKKKCFAYC